MNSAGNNKKTGYLVIALLFVGLTAYSNAVKELTEIHQFTLGAGQLIAQWSNETVPAEIPQIPQIVKLETCESKLTARPAELEVQVSADQFPEPTAPIAIDLPVSSCKWKARKHNILKINPRDREMLLKTLNRSINLRIAG